MELMVRPEQRNMRIDMGNKPIDPSVLQKRPGEHPLDSPQAQKRLRQIEDWWYETRQAHADNRVQMLLDADFYDGIQWNDDDIAVLEERGQAPLVFNVIAQHVNWILGTERRTRVDFKVHPRADGDQQPAKSKEELLKYISDVNKAHYHRSAAFADAVKVGVGWLEDGIRGDPRDEPLFSRRQDWRQMWYDHLSVEPDLSDARYLFRVKWVDTDVAEAMFPDRASVIQQTARHDDLLHFEDDAEEFGQIALYWDSRTGTSRPRYASGRAFMDESFNIGNRRSRNKLIECWYRVPERVKFMRARPHMVTDPSMMSDVLALNGARYDAKDPDMQSVLESGLASLYDAVVMRVRVAVICEMHMLQDMPSPYRHDRFPFTPIWGYRRSRDNMPYGPVRNMRDPQEDLNKRRSKALFLLSVNQLIADEDAFDDWEEAIDEAARPDGVLKKLRGSEVEILRNLELAEEHVRLMEQDMAFLQSASGVTEENRGEVTNTNSGTAIHARQQQGGVVTAVLFDNLRQAIQHQGESQLSLVEQFYAEPKQFFLTRASGRADAIRVNYPTLNNGVLEIENPITLCQSQFVVDTQDFHESMRLAMYDRMMETLSKQPPDIAIKVLDLAFELSDLENKSVIAQRIRKINGEIDPNDPEREAKELEAASKAEEERQLAMRARNAEIKKNEAAARKGDADSAVALGETMAKAVEIVTALQGNPILAKAVDILTDSFHTSDPNAQRATDLAATAPPPTAIAPPGEEGEPGEEGGAAAPPDTLKTNAAPQAVGAEQNG